MPIFSKVFLIWKTNSSWLRNPGAGVPASPTLPYSSLMVIISWSSGLLVQVIPTSSLDLQSLYPSGIYHLLTISSSSALTTGSAEQSLVGCGHSEGVLATVPLALGLQVGSTGRALPLSCCHAQTLHQAVLGKDLELQTRTRPWGKRHHMFTNTNSPRVQALILVSLCLRHEETKTERPLCHHSAEPDRADHCGVCGRALWLAATGQQDGINSPKPCQGLSLFRLN